LPFERNVFINCPFDDDYLPLLRPLIFTTIYLGFEPRIALERLDAGEARITKIIQLVVESKYGIHDLSRLKAKKAGEYFRLNMPFELGLDIGCKTYRGGVWATKKCLILEEERYRYQAAISDLSNSDIAVHGNEPVELVKEVRDWLNNEAQLKAPGPSAIWARFTDFMAANYEELKSRGFSDKDILKLPISELMANMKEWIAKET
jgi:hypothetical protein